jgi:hypothetical protein
MFILEEINPIHSGLSPNEAFVFIWEGIGARVLDVII